MVVLLLSFLKMEIGALSSNFVYDVYGVVQWIADNQLILRW